MNISACSVSSGNYGGFKLPHVVKSAALKLASLSNLNIMIVKFKFGKFQNMGVLINELSVCNVINILIPSCLSSCV